MAELRITDLSPYTPLVADLTTIYVGVDRDAAVDSEKIAIGDILAIAQNVLSLGADPTGAANANELFAFNNTTGDLFYVDSAGNWQAVPSGAAAQNLGWNAATSEVTITGGGSATLSVADTINPGLLTSQDFDKLALITVGTAVNLDTVANETTNNTNARVPSGGADDTILRKTGPANYAFQWEVLPTPTLTYTPAATTGDVTVNYDGGSDAATIPAVTITEAGLMIATDKVKLDAIVTAAQVPAGGADDYILKKQSATDYDFAWEAESVPPGLPTGGTVGDILVNSAPGTATWNDPGDTGDAGEVPWAVPDSTGATIGWVLKKNGAGAYDLVWGAGDAAANGIPVGGTANQILEKIDATDYNVQWVNAPAAVNGVPAGGSANHYLTKIDGTDYNDQWGELQIAHDLSPQLGGNLDVNGNTITGVIELDATTNVTVQLGDAAGANKLIIEDSGAVEVAAIDSDGNMTLADGSTVDGTDVSRVVELALYGETGHSLVAGDVGKPVADGGVRYDDTDYYNDALGVLTVRDDANTFTIASAGDRVFIPDAVVDPTYTRATDGNFMFWDDSANTGAGYWKPDPEADAALNSRELIMMVRDAGAEWEAVVL